MTAFHTTIIVPRPQNGVSLTNLAVAERTVKAVGLTFVGSSHSVDGNDHLWIGFISPVQFASLAKALSHAEIRCSLVLTDETNS